MMAMGLIGGIMSGVMGMMGAMAQADAAEAAAVTDQDTKHQSTH